MLKKYQGVSEAVDSRNVHILLDSRFYHISGKWDWNLQTDDLFCSDVFFALEQVKDQPVTRCLIYPDDVDRLKSLLQKEAGTQIQEIQFRVITTYGEVKTITGKGSFECHMDQNLDDLIREQAVDRYMGEKLFQEEFHHLTQLIKGYRYSEKISDTGIWYVNTVTHQTHYSDGIYRIHSLPPQSLNAHLHTFTPFVHPDDKDVVQAAIDQSYKEQLPLHLAYRILLNNTEVKFLQLTTHWTYTETGEVLLLGLVEDKTSLQNEQAESARLFNELQISSTMLQHAENMSHIASWRINLLTRSFDYSDLIYRIYGLKVGEDLNPNKLLSFVHPDDRAKMVEVNRQILYEQLAPDVEFRIIRPDGKIRYLRQKGKVIIDGNQDQIMVGTILDVSDTELLEARLQKAKDELAILGLAFSQMEEGEGIANWVWDLDTGEMTWSKGFYELLGYKSNAIQLSQRTLLTSVHLDDKKEFMERIDGIVQGGTETDFTFRLSRKNEIRNIRAHFKRQQINDQHYFIATFRDQTSEARLNLQLSEQYKLAEILSDSAMDRVFITDSNNYILRWNRRCEEDYGLKREKVIGKNLFEIFPQLRTPQIVGYINHAFKGERVWITNQKSLLTGGFQDLLMQPVHDNEGNVVALLHVIHDHTQEYDLRKQLTERLQFIEQLLQANIDRVVVLDRNMNYLYWNRMAENYYGVKKEEVVGRNILDLFPGFIDDPSYAEFRRALRGEVVHIPATRNLEGKKGYFETYLIPIKDEGGEVTSVLWIVHDLINEYHLAQHQRKANQILNSINEAYVEVDFKGNLRYMNPRAEEFWNIRKEEVLGMNLQDVFPETRESRAMAALNNALVDHQDVRGKFFEPVSGKWIFLSCTVTSDGVIMLFYDITDVKQTEEKLEQEHELLKEVQELARIREERWKESEDLLFQTTMASPDSITIYDLIQQKPEYLNGCLGQWTGFTNEELIAMGYEERLKLLHPDDRQKLIAFNERMLKAADGEVLTVEYRLALSDKTVWIRNRSKIFRRNKEREATKILSILQDCTQEISLRNQFIERSMYAETIIDASIDRIAVFDEQQRFVAWNRKCEEETGLKKATVIGRTIKEVFPEAIHDAEYKEAHTRSLQGEYIHIAAKKDLYSDRWIELFYIPLKDSSGGLQGVLNIMHDVTDMVNASGQVQELNQVLKIKNEELERKNEEVTSFAFVASHDLKEPLRKIHTFADWLLNNEINTLSDPAKNYIKKINRAVSRLELLIDDIMILTRIHADPIEQKEVSLAGLLQNVLESMKEKIKRTGTVIDYEKLPVIFGNESQLFYLFKNLLSNGIKFQKEGNVPHIRITAKKIKTSNAHPGEPAMFYYQVSFTDNGLGFDPRFTQKIFQVFQRLHSPEEFEGTGMGLAICKKVVETHGGRIVVESAPGKGSVFHCYFPVHTLHK